MPKYLFSANYTTEGMEGVRAAGAKSRVDAVSTMVETMGGRLEGLYFAFGDTDAFAICDLPDDEAATAAAVAINSSATTRVRTTKLLTADQVDEALRRSVDYVPPGS